MQLSGPFGTLATRPYYLEYMGALFGKCQYLQPTDTHYFLSALTKNYRSKWLTMNIDGLEEELGLNHDEKDREAKLIQLHGSLRRLKCGKCDYTQGMTPEIRDCFIRKEFYSCPKCQLRSSARAATKDHLYPDIQLYGQDNRFAGHIDDLMKRHGRPSLVLVMGTSLGSKDGELHVKHWRQTLKAGGKMFFVNRDPTMPAKAKNLFDYHLSLDCDALARSVCDKLSLNLEEEKAQVQHQNQQQLNKSFVSFLEEGVLKHLNDDQLCRCMNFLNGIC